MNQGLHNGMTLLVLRRNWSMWRSQVAEKIQKDWYKHKRVGNLVAAILQVKNADWSAELSFTRTLFFTTHDYLPYNEPSGNSFIALRWQLCIQQHCSQRGSLFFFFGQRLCSSVIRYSNRFNSSIVSIWHMKHATRLFFSDRYVKTSMVKRTLGSSTFLLHTWWMSLASIDTKARKVSSMVFFGS